MDFFPLGHQGEAGQGVVVLPAGQAADATQVGGYHLEAGPIPLAPDHALVISRCNFATFKQQFPLVVDQQLGVVKAAPIPFVDAQQDMQAPLARRGGNAGHLGPLHDDGLLVELEMGAAHQHRRLNKRKIGVIGQKSLWENNQPHTCGPSLGHGRQHPGDRALQTEEHRSDLGGGDEDWIGHGLASEAAGYGEGLQVN